MNPFSPVIMANDGRNQSFGVIGLGRIGGGLARQALERGFAVVGFDPGEEKPELSRLGLRRLSGLQEFRTELRPPRVVFLYIPAGSMIDEVLEQLTSILEPEDIVVDGGNSYWGDSIRRQERLESKANLRFVDLGTSGGATGARNGACFMAGGVPEAVRVIEPILTALSVDGGFVHCGGPGSGHFVKLVHNGIEFGMLQAIGEGVHLLSRYPEPLPVADVLRAWTRGSVIRSWLIELMESQVRARGDLRNVSDHVEDTGEVNWLVEDAMRLEVPIPVIAQSVMQLVASRDEDRIWARSVAMMRNGFGEHPFGADEKVRSHRHSSRVGSFPTGVLYDE